MAGWAVHVWRWVSALLVLLLSLLDLLRRGGFPLYVCVSAGVGSVIDVVALSLI